MRPKKHEDYEFVPYATRAYHGDAFDFVRGHDDVPDTLDLDNALTLRTQIKKLTKKLEEVEAAKQRRVYPLVLKKKIKKANQVRQHSYISKRRLISLFYVFGTDRLVPEEDRITAEQAALQEGFKRR